MFESVSCLYFLDNQNRQWEWLLKVMVFWLTILALQDRGQSMDNGFASEGDSDETQDHFPGERKAVGCRPVWRQEESYVEWNVEELVSLPASRCFVNVLNLWQIVTERC